jgi:enoyl-CoA hydratase
MGTIDIDAYEHVRLQMDDRGILTATITNRGRKNAVNAGVSGDLDRLWRDVDADPDIRVVVLTGDGDAFCAGLDLSVLAGLADEGVDPRRAKAVAKGIRDRVFDIVDCETPTVAKVRGPAYGMGVNIALACDFVVAAEDARFCDSHVKNGDPITGTEAAEYGLINKAVPEAELDGATDALAARLAEGPPLALAWTKLSINVLLKQLVLGAFETSIAYDMLSLRTKDVTEGSQAFLEKRKPRFTGT